MANSPVPKSLSIASILSILSVALNALATLPAIGADAALASVFINIIQSAMTAYHVAAGAPLDLSKLPLETPVP